MPRDWGVTVRVVESRPDWVIPLAELLALPGELLVVGAVLGGLYLYGVWTNRSDNAGPLCPDDTIRTIGVVFGGLALVVLVESLVGAPRPPSEWHAISPSPHGFPSGHTMAATVCWGAIAWWHRHGDAVFRVAAVGAVVALVGSARVVLGVHYLPDVLSAIALGVGYLVLADRVIDSPRHALATALAIAGLSVLASAGGSRALLAFAGTAGVALGWVGTEHPPIRTRIRGVVASLA